MLANCLTSLLEFDKFYQIMITSFSGCLFNKCYLVQMCSCRVFDIQILTKSFLASLSSSEIAAMQCIAQAAVKNAMSSYSAELATLSDVLTLT